MRFGQQNDARGLLSGINRLDPGVHATNWLDALSARRFIELDEAKQIAQIGDRQRRLIVLRRQRHGVADAQGRIHNGELSMQAKMDE